MSVLVEAISVVVRNTCLEEKNPGGLRAYRSDCPNRTFCADEHVSRVGFMVPQDVGDFVKQLQGYGLEFAESGDFTDIAIVDQMTGPTAPCPWLYFGQHPDGFSLAWLVGTDPHGLHVPDGWTPGQSQRMNFIPREEFEDRLLQVAEEDGLITAIDFDTGRETFIASQVLRRNGEGTNP